jgi:outer membrane receptor protein involved in Fe transport
VKNYFNTLSLTLPPQGGGNMQKPRCRASRNSFLIKTGDQFVMNARIAKTFLKRYEAYVAINNIFDSDFESELGFPGPGRNFYVGFSVKL